MLNKNRISRKMLMVAPLCLALALLLSACGGFGADWMWQESSAKEPNTGDMIVHVTGSETETVTGATSSDENAAGGPSVLQRAWRLPIQARRTPVRISAMREAARTGVGSS